MTNSIRYEGIVAIVVVPLKLLFNVLLTVQIIIYLQTSQFPPPASVRACLHLDSSKKLKLSSKIKSPAQKPDGACVPEAVVTVQPVARLTTEQSAKTPNKSIIFRHVGQAIQDITLIIRQLNYNLYIGG